MVVMKSSDLGTRMKQYEDVNKSYLIDKMPVVLRLDGKSFHSFTKGMEKPFDEILNTAMQETLKSLCEEISGCVFGYTQSDEMTIILVDYDKRESQPWLGNVKRKIESIGAALATRNFNRIFSNSVTHALLKTVKNSSDSLEVIRNKFALYVDKAWTALFDCRAFNLPLHEVENNLIWRQQDCIRNSINAVGQANFSHKQLKGKNCSDICNMLLLEKGIDWNSIPVYLQRGTCCVKVPTTVNAGTENEVIRNKWIIDKEIPLFVNERDYIRKRILYEPRVAKINKNVSDVSPRGGDSN